MRRSTICLFAALIAFSAATALTGCTKDRSVGVTATSAPAAHLTASFVPKRVDDRWVVGVMSLTNHTNAPLDIDSTRVDNQLSAFQLTVPDLTPVGAYSGLWNTAASGKIGQLAPGQSTTFEIKWRLLLAPTPKKDYPWTITIKSTQDGKAMPDVVIERPATPAATK
jgi:hypothetical protein